MISLYYSWLKVATTLLFIWPLCAWISELVAQKYLIHNTRLPDLVQIATTPIWENKKMCRKISFIKDIIAFFPSIYGAIVFNLFYPHLFDDFTNFMCGLIIIRCMFFLSTILPTSSSDAHTKGRLERLILGGCHDLIFSGHVAYFYASLLFLQYHSFLTLIPALQSAIMLSTVCIVTRDHYTVDIYVAFLVVNAWKSYILD